MKKFTPYALMALTALTAAAVVPAQAIVAEASEVELKGGLYFTDLEGENLYYSFVEFSKLLGNDKMELLGKYTPENISIYADTMNSIATLKSVQEEKKTFLEVAKQFKKGDIVGSYTNATDPDNVIVAPPADPVEELAVESVMAINATVDHNTDEQFLQFTINEGQEVTVEALIESGYEVEFLATADVFKDAETGELDKAKLSTGSFDFQVNITKEEETFESNLAKVTVENFANTVVSLDKYVLSTDSVVLTSNTLLLSETGTITGVKGTSKTDAEVSLDTGLTFKSSDTSKVLVSSTGVVTPVSTGSATITVKVTGTDVEMTIPVTVATAVRKADKVTTSTTSVGLITERTHSVAIKVTDQYGDPFKEFATFAAGIFEVKVGDDVIAKATVSATSANKGEYNLVVTSTTKTGSANLVIKVGEKTFLTLPVVVGSGSEVASRTLELAEGSDSAILDLNPVEEAKSTGFVYNKYNKDGLLIGKETDIGTASGKYIVDSSNDDNVTVAVVDGEITVTASKVGTSTITIKEGSITRASVTVTVKNTSPSITAVAFTDKNKITSTTTNLSDLLAAEGITITSSDAVQIEGRNIFIDVDGGIGGVYDEDHDVLLGTIDVISADLDGLTIADTFTFEVGASGSFALRVKNAANDIIAVNVIEVDDVEEEEGE